ncbi:MAG: tail fiber domain-containing protein [Patescibacteria group bacterium]|nr:tail fiber domain-containing protein [Patescibacteria group bacterium]
MDSDLYFEDEKYISVKRASQSSGYASDYIGQLCRAKKLKSKIIGRSWFVSEKSLDDYIRDEKFVVESSSEILESGQGASGGANLETKEISSSRDDKNIPNNKSGEFTYLEDKRPLIPEIISKKATVEIADEAKIVCEKEKNITLPSDESKSSNDKNIEIGFRRLILFGAALTVSIMIVFGAATMKDSPIANLVKGASEKMSFSPVDFLKGITAAIKPNDFFNFENKNENRILALIKKTPSYFEAGLSSSMDEAASAYHSLANKFSAIENGLNFEDKNKFVASISSSFNDFSVKVYDGANDLFSGVKNYFTGLFGDGDRFAYKKIIPINKQSGGEAVQTPLSDSVSVRRPVSNASQQDDSSSSDTVRLRASDDRAPSANDNNNSNAVPEVANEERKKNDFVVASDITRREVLDLIKQFDDNSKALIYATNAANGENSLMVSQSVSNLKDKVVSLERKGSLVPLQIDHVTNVVSRPFSEITSLDGVAMTNSSFSGTTGTFSGNLTVGSRLIVSGTATSTIGGDANFNSGTLFVDSVNNRVGIGTTSPSDTLALNGPMYFSQISAPSVTANRLYNNSGNLYWNGALVSPTATWGISGSDAYRSTGNVGIGTTSPASKLDVWGGLRAGTSATPWFIVDSSTGNMGIGTTSPNWKLSAAGAGSFDDYLRASYFTATSAVIASVFPQASTTQLSVAGNSWFNGLSTLANLLLAGSTTLQNFTANNSTTTNATSTNLAISGSLNVSGNSTLANSTTTNLSVSSVASTTNLVVSNNSVLGTIASGVWNGTAVATQYGGTGQNFSASSGLINLYSGTASAMATSSLGLLTTNVAEGTNQYWTNDRFDNRLSATTSLQNIATLANLATVGTITSGTWSGSTIAVSKGGTGQTSFTSGNLLYGAGTGALQNVATSTMSVGNGISVTSGSLGYQVGGSNVAIGIANNALTLSQFPQIAANSVIGNLTGSAATPTAVATSSLFSWNGTGLVVRDTSPTLTTPNLGTPSAGVVTNLTGTASININGTVGATTPTTGSFTTIAASGGYTQSGTSANTFTGTPTFSNATYSALFTGGNVGIGTTSPNWKLAVSGAGSFDDYARASYFTATSTTASTFPYASTTAFTVSSNSYLGTVSSGLWNGTAVATQYGGTGQNFSASSGLINLYSGVASAMATSSLGLLTTNVAEGTNQYWTNTRFDNRLSATTSLQNLTTLANLATVGTISSGVWNGSLLAVPYGGTGWASIQSGAIPYGNGSSAFSTTTAGTAGNVLALLNGIPTWTATSTLSTITGTLAVSKGGTGQTSFGQGWLNSDGTTLSASTSPTVAYLTATSTTATSTFAGGMSVAGSSGLTVLQNGSVGIGTASPGNTLHVVGSIRGTTGLYLGTGGRFIDSITDTGIRIYDGSDYAIQMTGGNTNVGNGALYVKNGGNVGIGMTTPQYKLDVSGDISSSQAIKDAISWIQNQGGIEKLKLGYNNGSFGGGATPGNISMTADNVAVYDTTAVNANSKGFMGAVFDGRYVYFVPYNNGVPSGQITRYDTTGSFTASGSYAVYDTTAVNANSKGFEGAVFDGRYVYFVPNNNGVYSGQITRYDTTGSFTASGSYAVYDTTAVNANSKGFMGAVFDGRYVYFVPNYNGVPSGQITRYDTTGSFTASGSYAVYDTTAVNANSKVFEGAVFDGRYVYFVPYNNGVYSGQITRLKGWSGGIDATPGITRLARSSDFYIDSSGNVGIGTTNPASPLTVVGDSRFAYSAAAGNEKAIITSLSNGAQMVMYGANNTTVGVVLDARSGNNSYFNNGGSLGVGTSSPNQKLSVYGNVELQGVAGGNKYVITDETDTGTSRFTIQSGKGSANYGGALNLYANAHATNPGSVVVGLSNNSSAKFRVNTSALDGGTDLFTVLETGNVGIGTTSPQSKLAVSGGLSVGTDYNIAAPTNGAIIQGNVGIGTTTPATLLEVGGATTNVTFDGYKNCAGLTSNGNGLLGCTASDERMKQNIVSLDGSSGLAALNALNPVSFYWKDASLGTQQQYGLIAQQVKNVFPNLVQTTNPTALTPDGTLTVNYYGLIAPMIKSIQELDGRTRFIANSATSTVLAVDAAGNVGIGTTTPAYKLHIIGDVAATSFVNISTKTAKKDISYVTSSQEDGFLDKIKNMNIAQYRYDIEDESSQLRLGLIAEEAPSEVLSASGKGVDIYKMTSFALAGVKAMQREIDKMKIDISALSATTSASQSSGVISQGLQWIVDQFSSALGIAFGKDRMQAKTVAAESFEMKDSATGEPYCVKISNGDWNKTKGVCGAASSSSSSSVSSSISSAASSSSSSSTISAASSSSLSPVGSSSSSVSSSASVAASSTSSSSVSLSLPPVSSSSSVSSSISSAGASSTSSSSSSSISSASSSSVSSSASSVSSPASSSSSSISSSSSVSSVSSDASSGAVSSSSAPSSSSSAISSSS